MIPYHLIVALSSIPFEAKAEDGVKVYFMNQRFMWIEAPSQLASVKISPPQDGMFIYWIEVKSKSGDFTFFSRRSLPFKEGQIRISQIRKILSSNDIIQIIGNQAAKDEVGSYSSSFEILRSQNACIGYFDDCSEFEIKHPEWKEWKKNPIDPSLYP